MDSCSLCDKAKKLLDYWELEYETFNHKPYKKRNYPYFYINKKIVGYKELVDMIAKGKLVKK